MKKRKPTPGLQEALDRLAALFDGGALDAATRPAIFVGRVCDEVERLRELVDTFANGYPMVLADATRRARRLLKAVKP